MPGCQLLVSLEGALLPLVVSSGTASYGLQIPNQPWLIGTDVFLQALAMAPGANPANAVTSNGLAWGIGVR